MKKKLSIIICFILIIQLLQFSALADAQSEPTMDTYSISKSEVEKPQLSQREVTINMLLEAGWSMAEIEECLTEEQLEDFDQNARYMQNSTTYSVNTIDENGEMVSTGMSRQQFDYELNQINDDPAEVKEPTNLSSSGVLELQTLAGPVYDGNSGFHEPDKAGGSYLKQQFWVTWMGNNRYLTSYRYEWETEPFNKSNDVFGIIWDNNITRGASTGFTTYTYKYSYNGKQYTVNSPVAQGNEINGTYCVVDLKNGNELNGDAFYDLMGYLQINTYINNTSPYIQRFDYVANYLHLRANIDFTPSISIDSYTLDVTNSNQYVLELNNPALSVVNPYAN